MGALLTLQGGQVQKLRGTLSTMTTLVFCMLLATQVRAGKTNATTDPCEQILMARGMYTLNALPKGLENCAGWDTLNEHLATARAAMVRINKEQGATGVMTGPNKLETNQHVAKSYVPETNAGVIETGCLASTPEEALPLEGIKVLVSNEPSAENATLTTNAINSTVTPAMSVTEAGKARREAIEKLERECEHRLGKGYICIVDKRRPGLEYALYEHRVYTNVALVFLPPEVVAYRDSDNFEHGQGRGRVDQAELAVYNDDGTPVRLPFVPVLDYEYIEGDRGFAIGTPGITYWNRSASLVEANRVFSEIALERSLWAKDLCHKTAERRPELSGAVKKVQVDVENSIKIFLAELADSPAVLAYRQKRERYYHYSLLAHDRSGLIMVEADKVGKLDADPVVSVATNWAERFVSLGLYGQRFKTAWALHRWARVSQLPKEVRPKGWVTEAEVRERIGEPTQDIDIELINSGSSLALMAKYLPEVAWVLGDGRYETVASVLWTSYLNDQEEGLRLLQAGPNATCTSSDPLMQVAKAVEEIGWQSRPLRGRIEEARKNAEQLIGLATSGRASLPNASGHPRLILSKVRGHKESGGPIPPFATLGALAGRTNIGLPEWFVSGAAGDKTVINVEAEFFVVGGVSGSPHYTIVGDKLFVVGWAFDGNKDGITNRTWQGGPEARGLVVTARGVRRFREIAGACGWPGCGPRRLPPCKQPSGK
ncbi:MAG: hypothetical protein A2749_02745 [Parcubacteria group bacterium RIFCSPHIGHO2_01_FULL_45_26]|nr:MAG: hypothetical protein A2749_02745 [Parcubacteria group bacterium RIFCSPHIGHO2_01_FULL_45_26]